MNSYTGRAWSIRRYAAMLTVLCLVLSLLSTIITVPAAKADGDYLLSGNRQVFASSIKGSAGPENVVDGDLTTRWESEWGKDPQWIYIDLGATASISRVLLKWEGVYSKSFRIEVSDNEYTWTPIYTNTNFAGGTTDAQVTASGRYVRMFSVNRAKLGYGVSLYEFEVYGTGGYNQPPKPAVPNVALNKPAVASTEDSSNPNLKPKDYLATNVTDGSLSTRWSSLVSDPQWVYVDLGQTTQIGKVLLRWEKAFARAYDIQVSNDAQTWTTVYRELHGSGGKDEISLYSSGRYVRMNGLGRGTQYGYSLYEFEVYPYRVGDPQPSYTIPPVPAPSKVDVGKGSYEINDITQLEAVYPKNKTANLKSPIPSNDWWQNLLIAPLGNGTGIITLPLKSRYTKGGLGILNPGAGFANGNAGAVNADGVSDLFLSASNLMETNSIEAKVDGYGDYSVDVILSDDNTPKLKTTFVKGSPYLYNIFADPNSAVIYSTVTSKIFDDNNNAILTADGDTVIGDHIGIEVTNVDNAVTPRTFIRSYGIFAPPGTEFSKAGSKIKMKLGGGEHYLSIAAMPSNTDLSYYYQHGYAFVKDTQVQYSYNVPTATVTTNFNSVTELKRAGFSSDTLMAMLPHQWKISSTPVTTRTYPSIRGLMKVHEGNSFTTSDKFSGLLPQFAEPNDPSYSRAELEQYLTYLDTSLANTGGLMNQDPYWQGKVLHPAALGALVSDQIGDYARRDNYLDKLRKVLVNWYTYSSDDALHTFYFHYNPDWGVIYPWAAGWGINTGITDHHYTYGYFVYASAVLASFDPDFKRDYGGMVEQLLRDYANPSKTDTMYPWLRSFDPYEGHSWAGGYADNNSGNNQEAAGEALDGWAGVYLWGIVTGNDSYRDVAAWGFTTELKAIEQYWFNQDRDNWIPEYNHGVAGQVWGSSYLYGTYFSGKATNIYGIHWLPVAEWMSYYGKDRQKAGNLYAEFYRENGGPADGWQHIIWPYQSLSDPQAVIANWDPSVMQKNEIFNSYWFILNTASYGNRTTEVWADNWSSVGMYKKGNQYTAHIWNPTSAPVTVQFRNAAGVTGSVTVGPNSLVKADPMLQVGGDAQAPTAPSNLTVVTAASDQVSLNWSASTDNLAVTGYDIYRNGTKVGASLSTSFHDKGLSPNTSYTYTVKARDVAGNASAASNPASVTTRGEQVALPRSGWTLTTSPASGGSANMLDGNLSTRWTSGKPMAPGQYIVADMKQQQRFNRIVLESGVSDYARGYDLYVSNDGVNWGAPIATGTGAPKTTIDVAEQTAQYIKLVQTGTATNWWSVHELNVWVESQGPHVPTGPATPANLAASAVSSSRIDLSWNASTDPASVTGYDIYRDGSKLTTVTSVTYSDTGLTPSTMYTYTVKAFNASGQVSAASNTASATTKPVKIPAALNRTGWTVATVPVNGAPAGMLDGDSSTRWTSGKAMAPGQYIIVDMKAEQSFSRIALQTNGNDYARGYDVYVSNDGTNWGAPIASGAGTSAQITVDFTEQTARYIRVVQTGSATNWWSIHELHVYG
ncbi:discoidin domain-containing protein [Paenibacillus filicis]|uniref:glucan endo-1,3-beta-D-glucosidase n=1 Tax=Paenibacillus filicis TaxID=669464 RepID=A0ABU9DKN1_9BACL